jgi:acetamidase/formamidase
MCGTAASPTSPEAARRPLELPDDVRKRIGAARAQLVFDAAIAPVAELTPGDTVTLDTLDCAAGLIARPDDLIVHIDELMHRLGGLNFVTGPFAVPDARPEDVLRVTILDIEPAPTTGTGFIALAPGFGSLVHDGGTGVQPSLRPATTICTVDRETVTIPLESGSVQVPARPFVGTIGVAPVRERRMTLSQSPEYVGDVDLPALCAGASVFMRVHHPGGLLSLGDVHAAQGDGEFGGFAVEVDAKVTITVDVVAREETTIGRLPMLVNDEAVGVIAASQGTPTSDTVRMGASAMAWWLVDRGMTLSDALQYLSAAARVRLGNMFEPFYSAFIYLERPTLPFALPADLDTPTGGNLSPNAG